MSTLFQFNPLKSIAVPNVGRVVPKGLVLVIGPNSAGKTQLLRDIHGRMLGNARRLVVCDDIEMSRPVSLEPLLDVLFAENHIRRRVDNNNPGQSREANFEKFPPTIRSMLPTVRDNPLRSRRIWWQCPTMRLARDCPAQC